MSVDTKRPSAIKILDYVVALLSLAVGVVLVFVEWPSPSVWSWILLAVGVVGIPMAYFNPVGRLQKWVLRMLVKRR